MLKYLLNTQLTVKDKIYVVEKFPVHSFRKRSFNDC